jgi:hypothetical protein
VLVRWVLLIPSDCSVQLQTQACWVSSTLDTNADILLMCICSISMPYIKYILACSVLANCATSFHCYHCLPSEVIWAVNESRIIYALGYYEGFSTRTYKEINTKFVNSITLKQWWISQLVFYIFSSKLCTQQLPKMWP